MRANVVAAMAVVFGTGIGGEAAGADLSAEVPVHGAYRLRLEPGFQTVGLPLRNEPVAEGVVVWSDAGREVLGLAVGGVTVAEALQPGREYYLELKSGPAGGDGLRVGGRFEVDEEATLAGGVWEVALDLLSRGTTEVSLSGLDGYTVEVMPHLVLAEAFPPAKLHADYSFAKADQVQVFNGLSFDTYYLLGQDGVFAEWRKVGAVGSGSQGLQPVFPGEGVFFKRASVAEGGGPVDLLLAGRVREHAFVLPLQRGLNFVAGGHPAETSFAERGALPGTFTGSFTFSSADQVSIHHADGSYAKYYLIDDGAGFVRWVRFGGNFGSENTTPVFDFRRATFVTRAQPDPTYKLDVPWTN